MVHDDTFIILKQNEQRRIINNISKTKAGKNNITTSMKTVSGYTDSVNIMSILPIQRACELIVNTTKNSPDYSDHCNLAHLSFSGVTN